MYTAETREHIEIPALPQKPGLLQIVESILPEITDYVELLKEGDSRTREAVDEINTTAGGQYVSFNSSGRSFPAWTAFSRKRKELLFACDGNIDEFVQLSKDAYAVCRGEIIRTVKSTDIISSDKEEEIIRDNARIILSERSYIEQLRTRYELATEEEHRSLIKALCVDAGTLDDDEKMLYIALVSMLMTPLREGDKTPMEDILTALKEGSLDSILYEYAMEQRLKYAVVLQSVTDLILKVSLERDHTVDPARTLQLLSLHLGEFPTSGQQELHRIRQEIIQRLQKEVIIIHEKMVIPSAISNKDLIKEQFTILLENLMYAIYQQGLKPIERQIISKKRAKNSQKLEKLEHKGDTIEPEPMGPRNLFAVRSVEGGYERVEGISDEQIKAHITEEYAKKHLGTPKLKEDLESMVDYIRAVDLSRGNVRGLRDFGETFLNGVPVKLYGLNPFHAANLPLHSKVMRQTRSYFLFDEKGDVAILRFIDKDEVPAFIKLHQLGASRRT